MVINRDLFYTLFHILIMGFFLFLILSIRMLSSSCNFCIILYMLSSFFSLRYYVTKSTLLVIHKVLVA